MNLSKSLNASKVVFLKAIKERLPFARPIRTGLHEPMWFCDFYYDGPLDDKIIPLLEETMRRIIKEQSVIKSQDMLLSNAIEFWKHHQNFEKSDSYEGEEDRIYSFLLIDKILEEYEGEGPKSTGEADGAHIYQVKKIDDHFL